MEASFCEISTVLLYGGVISLLIYLYGRWRNSVFRNTGIPGPAPDLFIGNLRLFSKRGFAFIDDDLRKQYGDVYGVYLGSMPVAIVYDLKILKEIFVKNFQNFTDRLLLDLNPYPVDKGLFFEKGVVWQRLRNILSPTFTGGKLRHMCGHMNTASKSLTKNLLKAANTKDPIDVKEYFGGFTMDTIASTAFGIQVDSQDDPNNIFVAHGKRLFGSGFLQQPLILLGMIFPSVCSALKTLGVYIFPKDSVQFFVKTVDKMIEERKQAPVEEQNNNKDFLQLLMKAEDNTVQNGYGDSQEHGKHKKMTTTEIFAQAFLFFAAGYETTATALQFASYALATNPEVQQKLIDEIESVIGNDEPTYDNIQALKYLDNVLQETLRMYPPVPGVTRQAAETVNIDGYTFPKGSFILAPILQIQRDPELYPDPHQFNPDRWEGTEKNALSWLPFGYGPRLCIGMRLAQVELKIALIHILRKVKFVRLPDTPDIMEFRPSGTLAPKTPFKLRIEAR